MFAIDNAGSETVIVVGKRINEDFVELELELSYANKENATLLATLANLSTNLVT